MERNWPSSCVKYDCSFWIGDNIFCIISKIAFATKRILSSLFKIFFPVTGVSKETFCLAKWQWQVVLLRGLCP